MYPLISWMCISSKTDRMQYHKDEPASRSKGGFYNAGQELVQPYISEHLQYSLSKVACRATASCRLQYIMRLFLREMCMKDIPEQALKEEKKC